MHPEWIVSFFLMQGMVHSCAKLIWIDATVKASIENKQTELLSLHRPPLHLINVLCPHSYPGASLIMIKGYKHLQECAYIGDDSSEEADELWKAFDLGLLSAADRDEKIKQLGLVKGKTNDPGELLLFCDIFAIARRAWDLHRSLGIGTSKKAKTSMMLFVIINNLQWLTAGFSFAKINSIYSFILIIILNVCMSLFPPKRLGPWWRTIGPSKCRYNRVLDFFTKTKLYIKKIFKW